MAASEAAINETDVSESPALVEGEGASPAGPSQPPRRLIISRSTGDIPGTGTYEQVDEELVHGFPHWKHVEGDFWLFSGADGKWYVGDAEEKRQGFESVTLPRTYMLLHYARWASRGASQRTAATLLGRRRRRRTRTAWRRSWRARRPRWPPARAASCTAATASGPRACCWGASSSSTGSTTP
eukprot:TRINITY_DN14905_c0_g1_i4.p2 TRINITY_DN14905_c0_g1~~TRINITY_DN14905_c0_g1_i4.p2  ORF type:complete len:183 (+),score=35.04 TRINITY_DN14905_c0_g1_i4:158-706(+)